MSKVKLFTHTDLDGVGCAVLAKRAYGADNVDVSYCDYNKIDDKVKNFITSEEYLAYDYMYITDISVNEEVAELIDSVVNSIHNESEPMKRKLILLDHHATASWLNRYWWATVTPVKLVEEGDTSGFDTWVAYEQKTAGTSMLFDYLCNYFPGFTIPNYAFVEFVRRWDTWDWFNVYGGEEKPKQLNSLLYLIGREKFVERFVTHPSVTFTEGESLLLSVEEKNISNYIKKVSKNVIRTNIAGYNAGVVFAEQHVSELGNAIANENTDLDFVAIINMGGGTISFRGIKDEIDLGKDIASFYGGGGHAKAAGGKFDESIKKYTIRMILGGLN